MVLPLVQQIDYQDPLEIFSLFSQQSGAIFLDSAQCSYSYGRYSFIAVDPFLTLSSKNGVIALADRSFCKDPFSILAQQLALFSLTTHPDLPPFQGGVAGYFGYDLYQHLEKLRVASQDDMQFPDMVLGFYDVVIAFDHQLKQAWIFSNGYPLKNSQQREKRAQQRLLWILREIEHIPALKISVTQKNKTNKIESNFTPASYQFAVRKVIDYIYAGDIFEANISQRFKTYLPDSISPFELYQQLRAINPAPFAAYLNFDDVVIASASPERFLQLRQQFIETRPIKGTCARSSDNIEDENLAKTLLSSEKNRAENIMIVDLLRNDLSRVCEDHSVRVPQLCGLESYATVHHLVSVVNAKLKSTLGVVDLLRATFPGGSITGAPKIRAMEIIAELEPTVRGPYCGSVGYIGFNGDMDSSILIRSYAIKDNIVTFQAGGAVVADSDPVAEYEETLVKSAALRKVLE